MVLLFLAAVLENLTLNEDSNLTISESTVPNNKTQSSGMLLNLV